MNKIIFGDCRDSLRRLAADGVRVQMCVTSPPYFGLRDYGVDGQIGLEQTPDDYVAAMVEVFRCVRDVLADDGTLWLNIGDTYARTDGTDRKVSETAKVGSTRNTLKQMGDRTTKAPSGLKDKDLIGIPWMLAFALRADGWYLRQDIIWHKPNPMPESVRDRCTKAHEYIFLLSKSERYFFDSEAMREEAVKGAAGSDFRTGKTVIHQGNRVSQKERVEDGKRNRRSVWNIATRPYKGAHFATFPPALIEPCILAGSRPGDIVLDPFMGSGTTAEVALQQGRQYLGCELNPEYEPLQQARIAGAQIGGIAKKKARRAAPLASHHQVELDFLDADQRQAAPA
ncbi:putative DNA methyltransferase [Ralstonia phage p2110]|nr:putative DNA methyltransferase [Ralstonia phage p2110]